MSDVKTLFRSPSLFSFVNYHTLLSLGQVPLPISSPFQRVFYDSDISDILASASQFHSVTSLTHAWPQWLALGAEANSITCFFYP